MPTIQVSALSSMQSCHLSATPLPTPSVPSPPLPSSADDPASRTSVPLILCISYFILFKKESLSKKHQNHPAKIRKIPHPTKHFPHFPPIHPKITPKSSPNRPNPTTNPPQSLKKSPPPINLPPSPPSKYRERTPSAAPHLCSLGPSPSMAVLRVPLASALSVSPSAAVFGCQASPVTSASLFASIPFCVPVSSRLWLPSVPVAAIYGCHPHPSCQCRSQAWLPSSLPVPL